MITTCFVPWVILNIYIYIRLDAILSISSNIYQTPFAHHMLANILIKNRKKAAMREVLFCSRLLFNAFDPPPAWSDGRWRKQNVTLWILDPASTPLACISVYHFNVNFQVNFFAAPYEFITQLMIFLLYTRFWLVIVLILIHKYATHIFVNVYFVKYICYLKLSAIYYHIWNFVVNL